MTTKIVRNVMPTRQQNTSIGNTSIILLSTSTERECKKWGKDSLSLEILRLQLQILRSKYSTIEVIVVTNENFTNTPSLKKDFNIKVIPNIYLGNENELQDIKFGLAACLSSNVIIICGNMIFNAELIYNISRGESKILVDENQPQLRGDNVGVIKRDNNIINLAYDIKPKWGKIVYLQKDDKNILENILYTQNNVHRFLFEGLNQFIGQHHPISSYSPRSYFLGKVYNSADIKKSKNNLSI